MAHDLAGLERKVVALREAVEKLHEAKHADILIPITHRAGFTTKIELDFVTSQVDDLHERISSAHKALDMLLKIADRIGRE